LPFSPSLPSFFFFSLSLAMQVTFAHRNIFRKVDKNKKGNKFVQNRKKETKKKINRLL